MGAGLVKVLTTKENRYIMQTSLPEALFAAYDEEEDRATRQQQIIEHLSWAEVIIVGPGLGFSELSLELLHTVIKEAGVPVFLDGDALSVFGKHLESKDGTLEDRIQSLSSLLAEQTILTPHLLELSRLIGVPVSDITNNLIDTAEGCSYNNLIYVIKDTRTIVTSKYGKYINVSGNNGMATGGSGDVLTGIIAALIGQGMSPYNASCLGVYLHGIAADLAVKRKGQYSLMASDIIEFLEEILPRA